MKMFCSNCNKIYSSRYCPDCGNLLSPMLIKNQNYKELEKLADKYLNDVINNEYLDEDYDHWFLETAMKCIYGDDIFKSLRRFNDEI